MLNGHGLSRHVAAHGVRKSVAPVACMLSCQSSDVCVAN